MPGLPALFDLSGRVAVVTGGGGALGRVAAGALAEAGASVAVVDLSEAAAAKVAAGLTEAGAAGAIGVGADLSSEEAVEGAFAAIDQAFGRIDILVNAISAAIDRHGPEEFPLQTWDAMLASNLTSYFLCSRAAAQRMIPAGRGGSIVNIPGRADSFAHDT
jgi:NAD(P)-dependent dehydrogenase (short-subunit alcohol dehydrogenase family)